MSSAHVEGRGHTMLDHCICAPATECSLRWMGQTGPTSLTCSTRITGGDDVGEGSGEGAKRRKRRRKEKEKEKKEE